MRPIVVFMQKDGREVLRESGGLPDSWYASFDDNGFIDVPGPDRPAVLFWPHEIRYDATPDPLKGEKPFDIATNLGVAGAQNQEEKHRHEREVYSAFCNTIAVHVAFLDAEETGDVSKYLKLDAFGKLAKWGRDFKGALCERFTHRTNTTHILVVVVKGEQVQTSEEGLRNFDAMLKEAGFADCYILDNDLGRGASGQQYHASEVWVTMPERLLLFFVLAEEKGRLAGGGVTKVWQAFESRLSYVTRRTQNDADMLEDVRGILTAKDSRDCLNLGDVPRLSFEKVVLNSEPEALSLWGGWSDYPVDKLGASCREKQRCDPEKWGVVKESASNISRAIPECRELLSEWLESAVHCSPAVISHVDEIEKAVKCEIDKIDEIEKSASESQNPGDKGNAGVKINRVSSISDAIENIMKKEVERQEALRSLLLRHRPGTEHAPNSGNETLAEAVKRAQCHYVGFWRGCVYLAVMASMAGWVIRRATLALGSTPLFAIVLSLAFAAGGFIMLAIMLFFQRMAGDAAVEKLRATAKRADAAFAEKDLETRRLVFNARERHCRLVRLGKLTQIKSQLQRVREVMRKEMEGAATTRRGAEDGDSATKKARGNGLLASFEKCTVQTFVGLPIDDSAGDGRDSARDLGKKLVSKWKQWCNEKDSVSIGGGQMHNGYFPAAFFCREIRGFLLDFQKGLRRKALQAVVSAPAQGGQTGVFEQLKEWCRIRHDNASRESLASEFASADVKDISLWSCAIQRFFVPQDPSPEARDGGHIADAWESGIKEDLKIVEGNVDEHCEVISSSLIDEARTFALFYREMPVFLNCNSNGVLSFRRRDEDA